MTRTYTLTCNACGLALEIGPGTYDEEKKWWKLTENERTQYNEYDICPRCVFAILRPVSKHLRKRDRG